jgi:hypothetical protein
VSDISDAFLFKLADNPTIYPMIKKSSDKKIVDCFPQKKACPKTNMPFY